MNRYVLTIDLRDDPAVVAAYRDAHARIWPDVVRSLTAAGVEAMDIYLLGRRLVMVLALRNGLTPSEVFARHRVSSPRVAEWEALMRDLQQPAPGAAPEAWWSQMELVYSLAPSPTIAAAGGRRDA